MLDLPPADDASAPIVDRVPHIHLSVRDTGDGIEPENLQRIFEPYYTTKAARGGTGLGLPVVRKIIENLGGFMKVSSQAGAGSLFEVYLPRIEKNAGAEETDDSHTHLPRGRELILLVDDEIFILNILGDMLASLGYRVETAEGSEAALDLLAADPLRFDLVIADWSMPHMNGKQLAAEIKKMAARLPIILCTGMSIGIDPQDGEELNLKALVQKPIEYEVLAATVRHVLDER